MRKKIQRQIELTYGKEENVWKAIPVDTTTAAELRNAAFEGDDLQILRWLLQKGVNRTPCSFGWYTATRRALQYMANRANVPMELIAITSAIFSSRTPVDLNMLATQLWDIDASEILLYEKFRTDLQKSNIDKFRTMKQQWKELTEKPFAKNRDKNELAKIWLFALTRPNWREIAQEELGSSAGWITDQIEEEISKLAKPVLMYGKTGNYANNLMGFTGVITVDTHMFKPVFGTNGVSGTLSTLLHRENLYQHFAEDYTDILEDLANELGLTNSYNFTPAGLQAIVWVMRQVAGQDFTKPVGFHRFHRLRDALAEDFLRPRRQTQKGESKSFAERILQELKDMYNNPKGTEGVPVKDVDRWKEELQSLWIEPLEAFIKGLTTLKEEKIHYLPHPTKVREPKRIFSVVEEAVQNDKLSAFDNNIENLIAELHSLKTKEANPLGGIQTSLQKELQRLAEVLQLKVDVNSTIQTLANASSKVQEAVHLPHTFKTNDERIAAIRANATAYEKAKGELIDIFETAAAKKTPVDPNLFISFISQYTTATTNAFWRRMFPDAKISVIPKQEQVVIDGQSREVGDVVVELLTPNRGVITLKTNLTATSTDQKNWFIRKGNTDYRIIMGKSKEQP